jgi:bifunctional non-homologous end joining protein LigD
MDFKPQNAKTAKSLDEAARKCSKPVMEIKYDGWRLVAIVEQYRVSLWSRSGKEYTGRVPEIEAELAKLPVGTILDGEIVDLDTHDYIAVTNVFGKSVAKASQEQRDKLTFVAFDCLAFGDQQVATKPLVERRDVFTGPVSELDSERVQYAMWHDLDPELYDNFLDRGYEGVIVKDAMMPYMKGKRGHGWFKIKATEETDVIITGLPKDGNGKFFQQVGRMVVSQYDENGALVEVAKVNCPDDATRLDMTENPDKYLGKVMTLKHYGKIIDGFRHPNFVKWREDKPIEDCVVGN